MARGEAIPGRGTGRNTQEQLPKDFARIREKVEKLTGERGDNTKALSAVRRTELRAIAPLQSAQVTAAPTMAQYNALQADVAAIHALLTRISNQFGTAEIPMV